jgi:hypothetical protein
VLFRGDGLPIPRGGEVKMWNAVLLVYRLRGDGVRPGIESGVSGWKISTHGYCAAAAETDRNSGVKGGVASAVRIITIDRAALPSCVEQRRMLFAKN